jgi:Zn-dependent protease
MICYFCGIDESNVKQCRYCNQYYCEQHFTTTLHDCPLSPIINPYEMKVGNQSASVNELMSGPTTSHIHTQHIQQSYGNSNTELDDDKPYVYTDGTYVWYKKGKNEPPEDAFNPDSGVTIPGLLWPKKSEFMHVLIASVLLFILATTGFLSQFWNYIDTMGLPEILFQVFVLAIMYLLAFLVHEFSHRQVAKHFKLQTKFRLFKFGVILTAICIFLPIKMALPGAVVVIGLENIGRETGWCKLAGPLSNLILGSLLMIIGFLPFVPYPVNFLILQGAGFNYMLGSFNMLPVGILDGDNIRKWKPKIWLIMFIVLVLLFIFNQYVMTNEVVRVYLQFKIIL